MGKLKRRKWQYEKKPPEKPKHVAPGLQYALEMAKYQVEEERKIRKIIATDNVLNQIQKDYTEDVEYWFYALLALALHDEGWGAKRIVRVQERIQDYHREYNNPNFGAVDLWQIVRDEVGLELDPGEMTYKRWKSLKREVRE